jgi:glycosyltransferase involved in cell wall biosynthesis
VRVGFDVTALLAGSTGVARYVRELGAALEGREIDVVRFAIGRGEHRAGLPPATRHVRVPLRVVQRAWAFARTPRAERLAPGCDLVHSPDLVPPPTRRPLVLTVHDLVALEHPELHPPRSVAIQRAQLAAARERATIVVSVSAATRDALCTRGVDPERVVVVPNGVTRMPAPDPTLVPSLPYFLAVGSSMPRKGLATLVAAFAQAVPEPVRLVLAGAPGWTDDRLTSTIDGCGAASRVVRLGAVTDARLAALYRGCLAVCVPSVAEGFGLPLLEAACAGAAVVASDLPVFREIDGAVAVYAPPRDVAAWADALQRVLADDGLRDAARTRGPEVARRYSWDRTASLTIAAYEWAREAA